MFIILIRHAYSTPISYNVKRKNHKSVFTLTCNCLHLNEAVFNQSFLMIQTSSKNDIIYIGDIMKQIMNTLKTYGLLSLVFITSFFIISSYTKLELTFNPIIFMNLTLYSSVLFNVYFVVSIIICLVEIIKSIKYNTIILLPFIQVTYSRYKTIVINYIKVQNRTTLCVNRC